ncbi:MAG: toxin-antitoxin system HicB family antitoxin [Lachnospiraceae bacterium]|nr:toxin-antitoxin system HicB family antitoxin [Lachnospiraceae bacterium]
MVLINGTKFNVRFTPELHQQAAVGAKMPSLIIKVMSEVFF